ncbi:hypothetical protein [Oleiharenicola sp. Vm1]
MRPVSAFLLPLLAGLLAAAAPAVATEFESGLPLVRNFPRA